ncbi:NAD-dependent epimerase/dehydratase [Lentinula raphanica]|nr:NAD-dependent epimerase/dehydratase [Lentinula raphanica]
MHSSNPSKVIVITGGNGFIGSHVSKRLYETGVGYIRVVDISEKPSIDHQHGPICHEFRRGNVCDIEFCLSVVQDADIVLHFAANMGGMGVIHEDNDFAIYSENSIMTFNILKACTAAGVKKLFYASSACVYHDSLQGVTEDVSLRERDILLPGGGPPKPQGLYGLEKLCSEFLLQQTPTARLEVRIARFHNIFGPGGAWNTGREKAPAALLRKAFAHRFIHDRNPSQDVAPFEIWGDGSQRRSFLYIDDAVEGIIKLLHSSHSEPVNIGSDESITIKELAQLALNVAYAGVPPKVSFIFKSDKPVGVAARNSNNSQVNKVLGWAPTTRLIEGMERTGKWIGKEIELLLQKSSSGEQYSLLENMRQSRLISLSESKPIDFAVLLPITSRGHDTPDQCLVNLKSFAESLHRTTWRDTHAYAGEVSPQYRVRIYLAIDQDDAFLLEGQVSSLDERTQSCSKSNKAEVILHNAGLFHTQTLVCNHPRGYICELWRDCARKAWGDGCDYFVLLGDDVTLKDEGWMRDIHAEFLRMAGGRTGIPTGLGCVAFTDVTFPGMPTFPVVHRTHMDIFNGEVVPSVFINQDGDPFLFQLYRRWACSTMIESRISNAVGGESDARYEKKHTPGWTYNTLDSAVDTVGDWLKKRAGKIDVSIPTRILTLDIVIPCYRVDLKILDRILALQGSETCSTMFIVIVDDPSSPHIAALNQRHAHRPDVRIRVNPINSGASYSRNRGFLEESAAEWVHFLDDDIVPSPDLLIQAEHVIRANPSAVGFVGNAKFPPANNIFTAALHLSGVTYFWDIATKIPTDVPWGVTANIIARRNRDGVKFDLRFPKTGGGEDIDFCIRKKREYTATEGKDTVGFIGAPNVQVTHPWWKNGARSYWRFYMWSVGDGALVGMYPEHCYRVWVPNSAEMILGWVLLGPLLAVFNLGLGEWILIYGLFSTILANTLHDCYRHLYRDVDRWERMDTNVRGVRWIAAVIDSSIVRMLSEIGRLRGILGRKEFYLLGQRFDWFVGRWGEAPVKDEIKNGRERFLLTLGILAFGCLLRLPRKDQIGM